MLFSACAASQVLGCHGGTLPRFKFLPRLGVLVHSLATIRFSWT